MKTKLLFNHPEEYANLFGGVRTLREFESYVKKLSQIIPFRDDDRRNKFKGDSMEILAELFFAAFESDPRFGLQDYEIVPIDEDMGVDAVGINTNGDRCVVQVKFRGNPSDPVTYSEIAKTFASGVKNFDLDPDKPHNIFIFTNANDVSHQCRSVFSNELVVVSRDAIKLAIDNNLTFWKYAESSIAERLGTES